jgi:hypothetical protein
MKFEFTKPLKWKRNISAPPKERGKKLLEEKSKIHNLSTSAMKESVYLATHFKDFHQLEFPFLM